MFERLNIGEIGGVGFIITPVVRHNVYKTPEIFNEWTGTDFEAILKSIKSRLVDYGQLQAIVDRLAL
jgi:hypothetical protein